MNTVVKQWRKFLDEGEWIPLDLPRKEFVAEFLILTSHNYLMKHLHRIGMADSPPSNHNANQGPTWMQSI